MCIFKWVPQKRVNNNLEPILGVSYLGELPYEQHALFSKGPLGGRSSYGT